jgi:hypothetical protein
MFALMWSYLCSFPVWYHHHNPIWCRSFNSSFIKVLIIVTDTVHQH